MHKPSANTTSTDTTTNDSLAVQYLSRTSTSTSIPTIPTVQSVDNVNMLSPNMFDKDGYTSSSSKGADLISIDHQVIIAL